jgi:membrane protein DedA with SNARE-associated domain
MVPWLPAGSPLPLVLGGLFVVAVLRAGATYCLARSARHVLGTRRWLEGPRLRRAEVLVSRFGAAAVTFCVLTVGVQTAVHATAGSLRMPLRRYLPALAAGAGLWAVLYAALGLVVLRTAASAGTSAALVFAGITALLLLLRRSRVG